MGKWKQICFSRKPTLGKAVTPIGKAVPFGGAGYWDGGVIEDGGSVWEIPNNLWSDRLNYGQYNN